MSPISLTISVRGSVPRPEFTKPLTNANRKISRLALTDARQNVSRHTQTGETLQKLRSRAIGAKGVEISDSAPQAWFLEEGTKPHIIRPKRAKALRFFGESGQPIFAREVHHPGTKPDPFVRPAIVDHIDLWSRIYTDEIGRELDRG